jgi:RNA 3'-terminal phosphate cyclase (ATP)
MNPMLLIDGSQGEGGGQVLRSALALSMVTGAPFRVDNIRARRPKPGMLSQHLTAVQAAREICGAQVLGAARGSSRLDFSPGGITPGNYSFSVGTAGSATLVLQTVLPALLTAGGPSELTLEGGTHNPFAPPFDFLARAYLPLLCRTGPRVELTLERHGFFPAGGGRITARVEPVAKLARLELRRRGELRACRARALVANLPRHIAQRELNVVRERLAPLNCDTHVEEITSSAGPGNVLLLEIESEQVTEVFTGFGERGRRAEDVAQAAADEARAYLESGVPVGSHLADQLMVPMALAGGGAFHTMPLTSHSLTNLEVIKSFLGVQARVERLERRAWAVELE